MIRLISSPYHLGHRDVGMGAGPERMRSNGAVQVLEALDQRVVVVEAEPARAFEHEVGAQFAVQQALAEQVRRATEVGDFPFVLGGNCSSVLGIVGGLGLGDRGGVVWFDAHGDANTPETTDSGFLDGMPVAVLTGRCWKRLAARIPGFAPLPDDRVLLAGVRSTDEDERTLIDSSQMSLASPAELGRDGRFDEMVASLATRTGSVHVHIDLDVIDTGDGHANEFATDGGPSLEVIEEALRGIAQHCLVNSISLTSYNPTSDRDGRALESGMQLLSALGQMVPRSI